MAVSSMAKGRRRSWLARASVVLMSATLLVLSACGAGNTSTTTKSTPGVTPIGNAGTLLPGVIKWGEDSTGGMPYIAPKDANNPNADNYGFEVDIANAMSKLMNVTQQPTQITWSDWPQGLSTHQFDFFMNGLEITPENAKSAKFSIPYYVYTQSIVVLSSNTTINSFADLAGKKVETGTDYKAQYIMEDWNAAHPSQKITIITTDSPTPFSDLDSHRADAEFIDTPIAKWYGANDPSGKYKTVGGDLNPGYYGIAFDPNSPNTATLLPEINQAIAKMYTDGTLQKIYQDGGAYNTGTDNKPVFVKYDMWNSFEACIGNFLPTNPTSMPNCPSLP
ncbi:MAG: substrate-binding periplasmic protein [Nitrososphaerota archaeon]